MASKSNDQGRAYEFAYLLMFEKEIQPYKQVVINRNDGFQAAWNAWQTLSETEKALYQISASAGVKAVMDFEPLILDNIHAPIHLQLQTDGKGESGDVRDLLISCHDMAWEIGLSIKHNHFAVKHSRLSGQLDFGKKWYGVDCSPTYWQTITPIFERLKKLKNQGVKWSEMADKETSVYIPILETFKQEILSANQNHHISARLVEYLLGKYDFYKAIGIDNKKLTQIQTYNLHGTLNQDGQTKKRLEIIPIVNLPTRIVAFEFKPDSNNTLEMYLDEGWQLSFRIHNASTKVEPSLKFDIKIIGMPTSILTINCAWHT